MKKIMSVIAAALLVCAMSTAAMAEPGSGASHGGGRNADFRHGGGHFHGGGGRHFAGGYRHNGRGGYHGGYYGGGPFYGYDDDDGFLGGAAGGIIGGILGGAISNGF